MSGVSDDLEFKRMNLLGGQGHREAVWDGSDVGMLEPEERDF